jgi:hypothetical protein
MTISDPVRDAAWQLADHGTTIWGDRTTTPAAAHTVLSVVVGDIGRVVRTAEETGITDLETLIRELGNLALSSMRLAVELGLDPAECVAAASEAQRAYVERRAGQTEVDRP